MSGTRIEHRRIATGLAWVFGIQRMQWSTGLILWIVVTIALR